MVLNKYYYGSTHKYKSSLDLPSQYKAKSHRPDLTWTMTSVLDLPPIMSVCDLRFEQIIHLIDWQTGWLTGWHTDKHFNNTCLSVESLIFYKEGETKERK